MQQPPSTGSRQLEAALDFILLLVRDGLRHGFFELGITSEIVSGRKRRLQVNAGQKHQYTIPPEEIDE
jgi:hypothetical protein